MFFSLFFEVLYASFTKGYRNFYSIFLKGKLLWRWKKFRYYLKSTKVFISIFNFLAHKYFYPSANNRRRKFESHQLAM